MAKDKAMGNLNYGREPGDLYETREDWITEGLIEKLIAPPFDLVSVKETSGNFSRIWEPACGTGKMSVVLWRHFDVCSSDIQTYYGATEYDFLKENGDVFLNKNKGEQYDAIITNPPYSLAQEFIEHALELLKPIQGIVCMLLRNEYDSAVTRKQLFADHPAFAAKYVLTARPWWFERHEGDCSPRHNYCWMVWSYKHTGPPTIGYIHKSKGEQS